MLSRVAFWHLFELHLKSGGIYVKKIGAQVIGIPGSMVFDTDHIRKATARQCIL